jgi:peptide/nickel transport system permease protein
MFSAFIGHGPLYRSGKKKKNVGKLFTPAVTVAFAILLIILFSCVFAAVLAPYDPNAQDLTSILAHPSSQHLLGTDQNGRDLFSRILYGGRTALTSALLVVAISMIIGIPLGLVSGYRGGKADTIIMRCCDVLLSFPSLLLAFLFVAALGRNTYNAVLALGIVYVPMLTRLTRSLTLVEKNKVYVSACVSLGYSEPRIIYRHILPNCISTILVQITLDIGYAILDLASLSFLGLGTQPPQADWGAMLDEGRSYLLMNPLLSLVPGIVILLVVVSLNIFSDGLHQYLDQAQTALPSFRKYEKKMLRKEAKKDGKPA